MRRPTRLLFFGVVLMMLVVYRLSQMKGELASSDIWGFVVSAAVLFFLIAAIIWRLMTHWTRGYK